MSLLSSSPSSLACFVGLVKIGGGLVQGQHAAAEAEGLGQREADHDRGQHALQESGRGPGAKAGGGQGMVVSGSD